MQKPSLKTNLNQLVARLREDHPEIKIKLDDDFHWSAAEQTLFYNDTNQPDSIHLLLHELAHAKLSHKSYFYDNELMAMELAAWEYSRQYFYPRYHAKFDQTVADKYLDYYRNWLYERSLCPNCQSTGQQNHDLKYQCVSCGQKWQVNEAKFTRLKRQKTK